MLDFLANNIEQLDLAREHILLGDANNARFGLILTDNAVEITLHRIALDAQLDAQKPWNRDEPIEHERELQAALGTYFAPKVRFAVARGMLDEDSANTVRIAHKFRNELYHVGLQHEAVLPVVSRFYFEVACTLLSRFSPTHISYGSGKELPRRAREYLGDGPYFWDAAETYGEACVSLGTKAALEPAEFSEGLADHLDEIVNMQDTAIEALATDGPTKMSRDEAVLDSMAWSIAFSKKAKETVANSGWRGRTVLEYVRWVGENCAMPLRRDPIARWRTRARSVRAEANRHKALRAYREFMDQTARARGILLDSLGQLERYIDEQIDRMREEGR